MKKFDPKEYRSIPNILCYIRLILIPVFIYLYIKAQTPQDYLIVAAVIGLSGITDFLDGKIARHFNMITELGIVLDPAADKLTQLGILLMLVTKNASFSWLIILLFIKEIYLLVNDWKLLKKGKRFHGSLWSGKMSTAAFFINTFLLTAFPQMDAIYVNGLMLVTALMLIGAFCDYYLAFKQMYAEVKMEEEQSKA
jgi:cardiolipin synthase